MFDPGDRRRFRNFKGAELKYDLIIRGGSVVDGSGKPAVRADVAVNGDRIAAIGLLADATADREIDATGKVVSPGFVDLHTHLDAQVGWDPYMTSSSWHGVTTVLMGNCGVTFAPVVEQDRSFLAEMMESVEDIPRQAILDGLPWDWETYPEYLDSVQRLRPALNVVGLVGHCAIRTQVMGERSLGDDDPTPDELGRMADIAEESVAGGAVGFSTSRILLHFVPDGRYVPGTLAKIKEYEAIADGMNRAGGGLFQSVNDFGTKFEHEIELLRTMAGRAGDVLFSGGAGDGDMRYVEYWDNFLNETASTVGRISSATQTRPGGTLMGLKQTPPVKGKTWAAMMALPTVEERLAVLRDPVRRAELIEEGNRKGTWYDPAKIYPLGLDELPNYNVDNPTSIATLAAAAGVTPVELIVDRLLQSEGREVYNAWFFNRNTKSMEAYLQLDGVVPGLGDAGAHAGQICDADSPTFYLSYWHRDRKVVSIETAVHQLTAKPAAVLGLIDRGTLTEGHFADINIFDPEALQTQYPEYVNDFPNGKGRFVIKSKGYAATIVNGKVVTEQGRHTGERPGRVIREFARG
jgi:N-acyl-D-amino-acid deacylase